MPLDLLLNARIRPSGHGLRAAVHEELSPTSGATWVIFIHGFNVSRDRALDQISRFGTQLFRADSTSRVQYGGYLWPSSSWPSRKLARITFPRAAEDARKAGRLLGEYLGGRNNRAVVLVGHSLGSVVALAAADRLRGSSTPLHVLALLGAAIEVGRLEPVGEFGYVPLAATEAVAYSPTDRTLKEVFRAGSWMAAPFAGYRGEAVGLCGKPMSRKWLAQCCSFSHHRYYDESASAELVLRTLSGRIGHSPARREPAEYSAPVRDIDLREDVG
jgi:pimeloyl-ACP methyl ester carboxylesterase